jgi:hypothetical protein
MFATSEYIALDEMNKLVEWTQAWYEEALSANYVEDPYQPEAEVLTRLHEYFRFGLTPEEAVQACFGLKH